MKKKIVIAFSLLMFLMQGCVPCLHPLYSKKTIRMDQRLEGKWINGENTSWEFKQNKEGFYETIYEEDGIQNKFEVYLVLLDDKYYLDFFPSENKNCDLNGFFSMHLLPAHTFAKVEIEDNTINIKPFNPDWVLEQIKNRYIRIKHEKTGNDGVLITASTEELQKFVIKYADYSTGKEEAFLEDAIWKKETKHD